MEQDRDAVPVMEHLGPRTVSDTTPTIGYPMGYAMGYAMAFAMAYAMAYAMA